MDTEEKTEQQVIDDLIWFCACAVNGNVTDAGRVAEIDLTVLYRVAERHMLTAVVAYALETAGVYDRLFTQAKAMAIRKMVIMDDEMAKILYRLEAAGIWYMPMKGAVLKELYPAYGIRQMSDRDILFDADRAEDVRSIMEELSFKTEDYGKNQHDCYLKPPISIFEMHRQLCDAVQGKRIVDYYADVKKRLLKDDGNAYGWHFSPEDFYLYMVVHEHKHYSNDGTGLRSLLDTYVYLKNVELDFEYVAAEAEKLGVAEFEEANRTLAKHLFGGEMFTETDRHMLQRFVTSGTYGNLESFEENQLAEKGRKGYFLSRITLPYPVMQQHYPVLRKMPVLYPFCWTHRIIHALIYKNERVMHQLKAGLMWKKTDQK